MSCCLTPISATPFLPSCRNKAAHRGTSWRPMDTASFKELLETRQPVYLDLSLPKFEIRYEINLVENLTSLGMGEAFDPGLADFSLMEKDGRKDLFISGIGHKTFLRIDESGTEAAAVTGITIASTAIAEDGQKTRVRPGRSSMASSIPLPGCRCFSVSWRILTLEEMASEFQRDHRRAGVAGRFHPGAAG